MERTLERAFFKEYQGDGAGMLSLKMALFKYSGIGSNVPARPDYPDGVIAEILERTGAIEEWPNNLDGCTCALFDEIGDNLDSLPSVEAMKRYAIEVISKFRDYAFHYRLGITGLNTISNTISSLKSIEYLFLQWHGAFITFTEGFAAILLKRGLNLIELQNQCGVTLIERLNPNRLLMFIGNDSEVERLLRKVNLSEGDNLNLPEILNNVNKSTAERGRPRGKTVVPLFNILYGDWAQRQITLNRLRNLINGKKGRNVALIVLGCMKAGKMAKPSFKQLQNEFGDIGNHSGFDQYMRDAQYKFSEAEIEAMAQNFI